MDSRLQLNPLNDQQDHSVKPKRRRSWFDNPTKPVKFEIAVEQHKENSPPEICDMETLVLQAFSSPPRLDFGIVKVGQGKTCLLNLRNPHDYAQNMKVQKFPSKKGFSIQSLEFTVEAESTLPVYISWEPTDPGNCRELIMCLVEGAYRVQAYVLGSCPEPPKLKKQTKGIKSLRKPTNAIGRLQKSDPSTKSANMAASTGNKLMPNNQAKPSRTPLMPKNIVNVNNTTNKQPKQPFVKPRQQQKVPSCNDRILKNPLQNGIENDPRMTVTLSKPTIFPTACESIDQYENYPEKNYHGKTTDVVETLIETYISTETETKESLQTDIQQYVLKDGKKFTSFPEQTAVPSPRRETYIHNSNSGTYSHASNSHNYDNDSLKEKYISNDIIETVEYIETQEVVEYVEDEIVVTETFVSRNTGKPVASFKDVTSNYSSTYTVETQEHSKVYNAASRFVPNDPDIPDSPLRRITFIKDDPSLPVTPVRRETFFKENTNLPNTPIISSPDSLDNSSSCPASPRSSCRMGLSSLRRRNKSVSPPRSKNSTPVAHFIDDIRVENKAKSSDDISGLTPLRRHGTYTKLDSSISPKPHIVHTADSSPAASDEAAENFDDLPFTSENAGGFQLHVARNRRDPKKLSIISEKSERDRRSVLSTDSIDGDKFDVVHEHGESPYSSKYATAYTTPYESPGLSDKEDFEDSISFIPGDNSAANTTVLENSQLMASLLRDKLEKVVSFDGTPPVKVCYQSKSQQKPINDSLADLLDSPKDVKTEAVSVLDEGEFSKESEFSSHVSIDPINESVKYHSKKESIGNASYRESFAKLLDSPCVNKEVYVAVTDENNDSMCSLLNTPVTHSANQLQNVKTKQPILSADDSIAHLLQTPGNKAAEPVPVYEDVKVEEIKPIQKTPSPSKGSKSARFSILQNHERSPSMYCNPFPDDPIEVSTLGFPNESFIDREKINLGLFKSLKKERPSRRKESVIPMKQPIEITSQSQNNNDMVNGQNRERLSSTPKEAKNKHSGDGRERVNSTETVQNEIKQRLSSTPKAQTPSRVNYQNIENNDQSNMGIVVQTPSPIIGRRVSRDTVTKSRSSVLCLSDLKESSQAKKGLFQLSSDSNDNPIRLNSSYSVDSPMSLTDLKEASPLEHNNTQGDSKFSNDLKDDFFSDVATTNPRRFSTLTVTKSKPSLPLPEIVENGEGESKFKPASLKQLFTEIPDPEFRRISTMTITKDKPSILKQENMSTTLGRKQLFEGSVVDFNSDQMNSKIEPVKKQTDKVWNINTDGFAAKVSAKQNLQPNVKSSDDLALPSKISNKAAADNKKKTRRSVAVMQTHGKGAPNKIIQKTDMMSKNVIKEEISPQKREHSTDNQQQGTRKRFRSEQMKKPTKVTASRRLSVSVASGDKKTNSTVSLRKQVALTSMAKNASATKRTATGAPKSGNAVKGLAKGKLTLMKQPKSQAALPKHPLPFAAKNMYYDERWMEKEDRGFVKWLNFILTPPDFYFDARKPKKIDAGKVFLETNQYNITMAPTKEVLSFKAYSVKRKLNGLRRSACKLFQSDLFVNVQNKLEREIECRRLAIRKDRLIFADLGLKQKILEMLLSYNPLWLRVGLETVYGEIVCVDNTTDILSLSRFIAYRFLGNPEISREYAHSTVPHLYKDGYYESLGQFTLKKFLMIVMFLDHAKRSRLVQEDPCLFCKDSEFKASKDMLLAFSRDFLAGEGDLVKHLGFLGYKVCHTQTALEEVDYAVSNLAVDLRDGLRLTRVVFLLTEDWKLLDSLRCPAISRLQKIHNVGVPLKCLTDRGVDLTGAKGGTIDARDIVDGHREKTLHLLWRIIFNFQVEQVIDLAKLQEEVVFLKKNLSTKKQQEALLNDIDPDMLGLPREPRASVEPSDVYFRSEKLGLLLRWCRAVCAHFNIMVENFTVSFSDGRVLCALLHYYHPELLPWAKIHSETSQTYIGEEPESSFHSDDSFSFDNWNVSSYPAANSPVYEQLLKNEKENFKTLYEKVSELGGIPLMLRATDMSATIPDEKVVITYVSYLCARLLDIRIESRAARIIQHAWREYRVKKHRGSLQDRKKAATVLQKHVRLFLARKHEAKRREAALVMQCCYRSYQARQQLMVLKNKALEEKYKSAAIVIQCHVKRFLEKKFQRKRQESAVVIQSSFRGCRFRKSYTQLRDTVLLMQAKWRANRKCADKRSEYLLTRQCVIQVQSCVRRWLAKRLLKKHKAACKIQAFYRMHCARTHFLKKQIAITKMQSFVKGFLVRKRHLKLCSIVLKLQSLYRARIDARKQRKNYLALKRATIMIQHIFRGFMARKSVVQLKAALYIQSCYRSYKQRSRYLKIRNAAVIIQRRFKAMQQGKCQYEMYKKTKSSIIIVQACVRGYLAKKQSQKTTNAAIIVQSIFRGILARKFVVQLKAAIRIQSCYRSNKERSRYLKMKNAAVVIQRRFKAMKQGKCQYEMYKKTKSSIIIVQACVRGYLARKQTQKALNAVKVLQSYFKMYKARCHFLRLKKSVAKMQTICKANKAMTEQKKYYQTIKKSVIKIQSTMKMVVTRRQYLACRKSIVLIQSITRRHIAQKAYQKQRNAAVSLQKYYKGYVLMKNTRESYHKNRNSVIKLQSFMRMYCALKEFRKRKKATLCLQSIVRRNIACTRYKAMKVAATIVQRKFRSYIQMKTAKECYQSDRNDIIKVQSLVRMHLATKKYSKTRNSIVYLQSLVKRNLAFHKYTKMKEAASVIQTYYRAHLQMKSCYFRYHEKRKAIIKIQSFVRMHHARKQYKLQLKTIICVQSLVRSKIAQDRYQVLKSAAVCIQRTWRAYTIMQFNQKEFLRQRSACIKVQKVIRGYIARKELNTMRKGFTKLQAVVKARQARSKYCDMKTAVLIIQQRWRASLKAKQEMERYAVTKTGFTRLQACYKGKKERERYLKLKCVTMKIQAHYRMKTQFIKFQKVKSSIILLQRKWKATLLARKVRYVCLQQKQCAVVIQSAYRKFQARNKFLIMKGGITKLQSLVRARIAKKTYTTLRKAVVVIQTRFRAAQKKKQYQKSFLKTKVACVKIQTFWRCIITRKKYLVMKRGIVQFQALVRGLLLRKKNEKLKQAIVILQHRLRATLLGKKCRNGYLIQQKATITIQSYYRKLYYERRYKTIKKGFILLQALIRGHIQRKQNERLQEAVIILQNRLRATLIGKKCRKNYVILQKATIKIQSHIRKLHCIRDYNTIKRGFILLQSIYRSRLQQRHFLAQKLAVLQIQQWWRSVKLGREQERKYCVLKCNVITLQTAFRGYKARKDYQTMKVGFSKLQAICKGNVQRLCFLKLKRAALTLQYRLRAALVAKRQRRKYLYTIVNIVTVQTIVRRNIAMTEFNIMKTGFTKLQAVHRARILSTKYRRVQNAAVTIQRCWRAACIYKTQKDAAAKIQTAWRGFAARREYKRLKKDQELKRLAAAVVLQHHIRKYLSRKKERMEMKRKISCIVKIQSYVRKYLAKQRGKQLKAVICIQAHVRGFIARKHYSKVCSAAVKCQTVLRTYLMRNRYLRTISIVKSLQMRWKAILVGRMCRKEITEMDQSALKIQTCYRCYKARKHYKIMRNGFVKFQSLAKKYLYRKHYGKVSAAAVVIQQWWRSLTMVQVQRTRYLKQRKHVMTIQRVFRRYVQRKMHVVNAATTIQKFWRGYILRRRITKLRMAVVTIQKRFRSCRQEILQKRKEVASFKVQSVIRMYITRKKFLQTRKSVVTVQTLWRGRKVRKEMKDVRIKKLRARIERANSNATEEKSLANRTISALDFLLKCKDLGTVLGALMDLDVVTKLLPECCERLVEANAVHVLYRIIQGSNRSIPHQELIRYAVSTLLNLAKYDKTADAVYHGVDSVSLLVEQMSIYRDKKGVLFPQLCTLLGMVAHVPNVQEEVTQMPKLVEKLRSIQSLVARKHKMEQGRQKIAARMEAMKSFNCTLPLMPSAQKKRAKVKPEWVLKKGRLSHITDPMEAIDFVLESLQIPTK